MDRLFNRMAALRISAFVLLIAAVTFAGCGTTDSPLEKATLVDPIAEPPLDQCIPTFGKALPPLDLNEDGVDDFWFGHHHYQTYDEPPSGGSSILHIRPVNGGAVHYIYPTGCPPLHDGEIIDGSIGWSGWGVDIARISWHIDRGWDCFWRGDWAGIDQGNLALRITIDGRYHYGWAKISVSDTTGGMTLHSQAWESTPDFPIQAGMPPTSGF